MDHLNPFKPLVIDNRPIAPQFIDGSPLTDGIANLFASAINAPLAQAQIRRRRESEQMDRLFRQQQQDRQTGRDQMSDLWRQKEWDRQTGMDESTRQRQAATEALALAQAGVDPQDQRFAHLQPVADQAWQSNKLAQEQAKAGMENVRADNARQTMGMLGRGAAEIGKMFMPRSGSPKINSSTGWHKGDDGKFFRTGSTGNLEIYDPETKTTITANEQGIVGDPNAKAPEAAAPALLRGQAVVKPPGLLDRLFGDSNQGALATAGVTENEQAAVQAMRSGDSVLDVKPGSGWYKAGLQGLAKLDEKTREAELREIAKRDRAYALQLIQDLMAAGVR